MTPAGLIKLCRKKWPSATIVSIDYRWSVAYELDVAVLIRCPESRLPFGFSAPTLGELEKQIRAAKGELKGGDV